MILEEARIGEAAFSSPLTDLEIDVFFALSPDEVGVTCDRHGDLNRLGVALHLCVVKMTGRAELSAKLVPHVGAHPRCRTTGFAGPGSCVFAV